MPRAKTRLYDNATLSVIIRFHTEDRLAFLEEAIFSLAIQEWVDLEILVVLQNGTEDLRQAVAEIVNHQPWPVGPQHKIITVDIPGNIDGRSTLLNRGIEHATGRYLAFLDDDDFVYHHGYTTLIRQLMRGEHAIAVGGCRRAVVQYESQHWFVQTKDNFFNWGRSRSDLFKENFVPIHSYVIDRSRISTFELSFNDSLSLLEDYDFLLRLFAEFEPDFSTLDVPVCEYRIRTDGSNSIPHTPNASPEARAKLKQAQQHIHERKKSLISRMPLFEQIELTRGLNLGNTVQAPEGSMESRRVMLKVAQEIYEFFSRHPWWEERLSKALHNGWEVYSRHKQKRMGKPLAG
ncbi:MAG: glycosyltransferase family 2 protein [Pyrinomonadaceae bacterium]